MATLKEKLKEYFYSGKKPSQDHFHQLIDAYVHREEDGLYIDEKKKNIGIGTGGAPETKLHVSGGLKIGFVGDNQGQIISPGTLQWDGAKLQIFFNDAWQDVWPAISSGPTLKVATVEHVINPEIELPSLGLPVQTGELGFPAGATKLSNIRITVDYKRPSTGKPSSSDDEYLSMWLFPASGVFAHHEIWAGLWGFKSTQGQGYKPLDLSFDVTGDLANKPSFYMRFNVEQKAKLSVRIKKISITCLTE